MAGIDNLVPLTTEKAREIGRIGAQKSIKARREKKQVKELLKMLLENPASENHIKMVQNAFPDIRPKTLEEVLNLAIIKEGVHGNVQAYNAIYDRIEGKAQQKTDITTDGEKIEGVKVEIIPPK